MNEKITEQHVKLTLTFTSVSQPDTKCDITIKDAGDSTICPSGHESLASCVSL